ncbi:putative Zn-binding protein involved in type VI secretion [Enterobacter sp. BIGb0383]|uniref:PAAR domain-containing protein n=1 Tax=unclassified Enterobacter TaxID=2608935 RepID=UPI000F494C21|nr:MULTISPECIES: PAAR domain-containing protein [unclassified Enterobacter]ROP49459.1 putative Zn-binding protein involved in type VI secretion [Enterobacter sp. BIGb0383]ROS00665.1 putative Zn-binding protein involved in type VI secretion [Enterobacter sp. BIGb0359]
MPALACLGDATTHGGKIISASSSMFINGLQVALAGDIISCPIHGPNRIIEGDPRAFENGVSVVVHACLCECGCRIISSQTHSMIES